MNTQSDQELLRVYAGDRSEPAFAELVRRHVDLVYSAALRMVGDAHFAKDVTQDVFVALARNAAPLAKHPVLSGWLHRSAKNLATNVIRARVRRQAREQEAVIVNELLAAESESSWEQIAPHLDAALGELNQAEHDAVLLRYFEKKSAAEMAALLGISEDAAQKRVSRAVEKLREIFAKRKITFGAGGLVVLISANAVQSAPAGLAVAISAAALAGTAVTTSTIVAATKIIAMTTLQKTLITATVAVLAGVGIYEARQAAQSREQVQLLEQKQAPMIENLQQLTRERDEVRSNRAAQQAAHSLSDDQQRELLKLRGEVARLRTAEQQLLQLKTSAQTGSDPFINSVLALTARAAELNQQLENMPDKRIPELRFLQENDWLDAARDANLQSEEGIRQALSKLRNLAKCKFGFIATHALDKYISAHDGQLPTELAQLTPYFEELVGDEILQRYEILRTGNVKDLPKDAYLISEKAPVDRDYDSHLYVGPHGRSGTWGTGKGETGDPDPNWTHR